MKGPLLVTSFLLNFLAVAGQGDTVTGDVGFYHLVSKADGLCTGVNGPAPSFAGWIGLEGDSDMKPKRSFFWCVLASVTAHETM